MKNLILISILFLFSACINTEKQGDNGEIQRDNTEDTQVQENNNPQYVSYMLANGEAQIVEAKKDGIVTNISELLAKTNAGQESWINLSPNGEWILLDSTRLDSSCEDWACLIYGKRDASDFKTIKLTDGSVIHPENFSAISNDAKFVVVHLSQDDGNDLFVSTQDDNNTWSELKALTASSPSTDNKNPSISADGTEVLFDCGENICLVNSDGTNLKTLIRLDDKPNNSWESITNADFDTYGNIVFQGTFVATWPWRYNRKTSEITLINNKNNNDNFPCVLSNGDIATLWFDRAENNSGNAELKIMNATGTSQVIAITGDNEIFNAPLGCGGL